MEDIEKRLRETSDKCIKTYEAWNKEQGKTELREELQEAVHELRKVASRLEIEMAKSERDEMAKKPIPVPSHRASRKKGGKGSQDNGESGSNGDDAGNGGGASGEGDDSGGRSGGRRRKPNRNKSSDS